ncbi:MAG: ATP-dependent Clp protease proteolytic subunit [Planctomycetota bacterium]|jgi:ATP-dependent Clp protease protease subunit|nr:ATP-dependent Clp protease proteolytic subunit [Planctomycetota bacterium]
MSTVLLPKSKETREVSLDACLLEERIVFLGTQVDNKSSVGLVQQLLYLEAQDAKKPITLYINSPGGSVIDGMAIYDTIRRIKPEVHALVSGMAASMGAVILSGCEKGHRRCLKHSEVLLHQPLGGAQGPATDIQISAQRILKTKEQLIRLLAVNSGQEYEKVLEDCDRDYWLDAEEALAYGIIDEIL